MSDVSKEDRQTIRRALKEFKKLKFQIKPLETEMESHRTVIKTIVGKYETDFDLPEGRTESRPTTRTSYDTKQLDEMIAAGVFDADTCALILQCRKETQSYALFIH